MDATPKEMKKHPFLRKKVTVPPILSKKIVVPSVPVNVGPVVNANERYPRRQKKEVDIAAKMCY